MDYKTRLQKLQNYEISLEREKVKNVEKLIEVLPRIWQLNDIAHRLAKLDLLSRRFVDSRNTMSDSNEKMTKPYLDVKLSTLIVDGISFENKFDNELVVEFDGSLHSFKDIEYHKKDLMKHYIAIKELLQNLEGLENVIYSTVDMME